VRQSLARLCGTHNPIHSNGGRTGAHEEVAALADACGRHANLVREAAGLRVKRVDVASGRLDIAETMVEVRLVADQT